MDNWSYQENIDHTAIVFADTRTQTKRKVRSVLGSCLKYCSNRFITRFDSNSVCILEICAWYSCKINKNSTNQSPKSFACGGHVLLKMYYFSAYGDHQKSLTIFSGASSRERTQVVFRETSISGLIFVQRWGETVLSKTVLFVGGVTGRRALGPHGFWL